MTNRERLSHAFREDIAEKMQWSERLEYVDEEVAKAALSAFGGALAAAQWLTSPSIAFSGKIPLKLSATRGGRAKIILQLARIDRGIAM